MIATLPISGNLILGSPVKTEETIDTNTKIKFEISENIKIEEGKIINQNLENIPYKNDNYVLVKSEEEIEQERVLEKWQESQKYLLKNLPSGKFIGNFSAYTAAADECGKYDGITASGLKVKESRTLACPPQYPFGTKVKIEGIGILICEDRGGAIKGNKFDIYMETKKEAFAFGRQHLEAEVVD